MKYLINLSLNGHHYCRIDLGTVGNDLAIARTKMFQEKFPHMVASLTRNYESGENIAVPGLNVYCHNYECKKTLEPSQVVEYIGEARCQECVDAHRAAIKRNAETTANESPVMETRAY